MNNLFLTLIVLALFSTGCTTIERKSPPPPPPPEWTSENARVVPIAAKFVGGGLISWRAPESGTIYFTWNDDFKVRTFGRIQKEQQVTYNGIRVTLPNGESILCPGAPRPRFYFQPHKLPVPTPLPEGIQDQRRPLD